MCQSLYPLHISIIRSISNKKAMLLQEPLCDAGYLYRRLAPKLSNAVNGINIKTISKHREVVASRGQNTSALYVKVDMYKIVLYHLHPLAA